MKKLIAIVLSLLMLAALAACGNTTDTSAEDTVLDTAVESVEDTTEESVEDSTEEAVEDAADGVMSYAEYEAAELDAEVVVETYVQAKQGWWEDNGVGKATFYTQDEDGAYFLYDMPCSKEDYDAMTIGSKIKVTGYKAEWAGEVEIIDATYELLEGEYVAEAKDVTALLGTDELISLQNQFVSFKGMTVEASKDADGNDVAYLYKWDGSGQDGDDLYFNVSLDGNTYTFTVESYLCGSDTDVYAAVKALNIGDKIDMEGFLYWYEGVNPHITAVAAAE